MGIHMAINLSFDASRFPPLLEITAAMRRHAAEAVMPTYKERMAISMDQRHRYFLNAVGAKSDALDVATAKRYVRARAAASLGKAFEVFETLLLSDGAKLADRMQVAEELLKRAVGPAQVPNAISDTSKLTDLAPADAIDTVMTAYANGECDDAFVKTLLGLLGAKVNGLKLEQGRAKKSADKVGEKIAKPPSGKVV